MYYVTGIIYYVILYSSAAKARTGCGVARAGTQGGEKAAPPVPREGPTLPFSRIKVLLPCSANCYSFLQFSEVWNGTGEATLQTDERMSALPQQTCNLSIIIIS